MTIKKRLTKKILFVKTIEVLQPILNLKDWTLSVRFSSRMKFTADCEAFPEYKEAIIRINYKVIKNLSYYDIVAVAVHEMMHCIVWPLGDWAEKLSKKDSHKIEMSTTIEEGVVTNLERIMIPLVIEQIQVTLHGMGYGDITMHPFEHTELIVSHETK